MPKVNHSASGALIFIDTNIFLDFYRFKEKEVSKKYLEQILDHKEILITTQQVEMEFKKNRQKVLSLKFDEIKKYKTDNFTIPDILQENNDFEKSIRESTKKISEELNKLHNKMHLVFKEPEKHDPVYKIVSDIFKNVGQFSQKEPEEDLYKKAERRFKLGYPPRKAGDNSIGDAINWEWMINCAELSGKDLIIVSRDGDFGADYDKEPYINNWLDEEFKTRVGKKAKIILTNKLSSAFDHAKIDFSEELILEEKELIANEQNNQDIKFTKLYNHLANINNILKYENSIKEMKEFLAAINIHTK